MKLNKKNKGISLIIIGVILIITSATLFWLNVVEENSAAKKSKEHLSVIKESQEAPEILGSLYFGTIIVEKLNLELPVLNTYTEDNLKEAPCRYLGTLEENNVIIAAHNYKNHFGNLGILEKDDEITVVDMKGDIHKYKVINTTSLDGTQIDKMQSGEWDLTLFTCNLSGKQRVTVRCEKIE